MVSRCSAISANWSEDSVLAGEQVLSVHAPVGPCVNSVPSMLGSRVVNIFTKLQLQPAENTKHAAGGLRRGRLAWGAPPRLSCCWKSARPGGSACSPCPPSMNRTEFQQLSRITHCAERPLQRWSQRC